MIIFQYKNNNGNWKNAFSNTTKTPQEALKDYNILKASFRYCQTRLVYMMDYYKSDKVEILKND